MSPRVPGPPEDPALVALHYINLCNRGLLPALLSPAAREEQGLAPLSFRNRDRVLALLDLPEDSDVQTAAILDLGPKRAERLLTDVVRQPERPGGPPHIIQAYQDQQADGVMVLLQEIQIWLTGLTVFSCAWTNWPGDLDIPDLVTQPAIRWMGFSEITDDTGTQYTGIAGYSGASVTSDKVSSAAGLSIPRARQLIDHLYPGPPPEARELVLHTSPTLQVAQPANSPPPWPEREVELPQPTYTLHLDERIKELERRGIEPQARHGSQQRR